MSKTQTEQKHYSELVGIGKINKPQNTKDEELLNSYGLKECVTGYIKKQLISD